MDQDNYGQSRQSNLSLASLVVGIVGIVTSCSFYGGLIFGSLGILFALLSRTEDKFEKYAKTGLIISSIALGITVLLGILVLILAMAGDWQLGGVLG